MKKYLLTVLVALVLCSVGMAQVSSDATIHVYATVLPNIAVTTANANINLNSTLAGVAIGGNLAFQIHANREQVDLQVAVTDLYKGDVPTSEFKLVVAGAGAQVTPENANQTEGGTGLLPWTGDSAVILANLPTGWSGKVTTVGTFESATSGNFSQGVNVGVSWNTNDFELPTGEYSGYVKLIGLIKP
jgi:hypothetical protein